jgi:hypothetical protein
MSLKARIARLGLSLIPPAIEYVWVYFNAGGSESSYQLFPENRTAFLYVGANDPHPFPAGVHLYGMERGKPYPTRPPARRDPETPGEPEPLLSAEDVDQIWDILVESLSPRLATFVRSAHVVLVIS